MTTYTAKPNLLLWGLIFLSVGVHLILLMHIAGLYRPGTPLYIELDLRTISKPIQRDIPRPQDFPDPTVAPGVFEPLGIPEEGLFQDEITAIPPLESLLPKQLPEPLRLPKLPVIKDLDIATWEGEAGKLAIPEGGVTRTGEKTRLEAAYMSQVGQMISAKAERFYRKKARKRQLQGRTVVQVVIGNAGVIVSTRVAESSNHSMLDQIALKAVKDASPFPEPPGGMVTLYIPINFKLI